MRTALSIRSLREKISSIEGKRREMVFPSPQTEKIRRQRIPLPSAALVLLGALRSVALAAVTTLALRISHELVAAFHPLLKVWISGNLCSQRSP